MEKFHLKSANSLLPLTHKPTITMTTKMLGIEHSFCKQIFTYGFLTSMSNVQTHFPYGFTIGGQCLDV